jgi:hypothetical protein
MEYTTILASKPGQPPPRMEKRANDVTYYQIDCGTIVNKDELIIDIKVDSTVLIVDEVRPKLGRFIVFRLAGVAHNLPYADYVISFLVRTTFNNQLEVPVSVRVYSS